MDSETLAIKCSDSVNYLNYITRNNSFPLDSVAGEKKNQ